MKKKRPSLTTRLIVTMIGIVAGTVILCWFFNNTFLERYYIYNKQKELLNGYKQVAGVYQNDAADDSDFDITFETICANGNINMLIVDKNGILVRSSYSDAQRFQMQLENMVNMLYGEDHSRYQVLVEKDNYVIQRQTDDRLHAEYLVMLGILKDGSYIYMRTPLESIRESAAITNEFFLMESGVAILLSVLVIIFMSRSISKPIRSLSDISRRMTELDFEARYQGDRHVSREWEERGQAMKASS